MRDKKNIIIAFLVGVISTLLLFFLIKSIAAKSDDKIQNDFYIITNQIKKMNKMVVVEQDFSSMQKTKITSELLGGGILPPMQKEIITFTKTNAQVSYDLNKMKIEVDSIGKKLILSELPNPEIRVIPSVEIQSMDDSFFDRFNQEDIRRITQNAKSNAEKTVNRDQLIRESKKQLLDNLNQIFVLAKALNYKIEDKTGTIDVSQL